MEHYYSNIGEDWFTYSNLYSEVVKKFNNAKFVEVGSWKGRSSVFMGVEIINSQKNIEFYCVDTWEGSKEHEGMEVLKENKLYKEFIKNINPISHIIKPIRMTSNEASSLFLDQTLDFVFIDADHEYKAVKNDIEVWYPKVKSGGIIAGHDYQLSGVKSAINDWCKQTNNTFHELKEQYCWIHYKK
jgi:predicted O-methyltransferase YrrM